MILASWSALGRPLGGLLARLGGLWDRFGITRGVLERPLGVSWPSGAVLESSWGPEGPSWGPLGSVQVTRAVAGNPGRFGTRGSGPLKTFSGPRTEAQGTGLKA